MDKFYSQLDKLMNKEVQRRVSRRISDYDRTKADNSRLDRELRQSRIEVRNLQNELQNVLKTSVQQAKQDLTGGFKVGEKIWTAAYMSDSTTCATCEGNKKVTALVAGTEMLVRCPSCNGDGYHSKSYYEPFQDEIVWIHIHINSKDAKDAKYSLRKKNQDYGINQIFKTLEDCQKYCDEHDNRQKK